MEVSKMAKYQIPESSDLGQRLLEISGIAGSLILCEDCPESFTKTKIIEDLNDIIRTAKGIRNKLTLPVWKDDIDQYKVKE